MVSQQLMEDQLIPLQERCWIFWMTLSVGKKQRLMCHTKTAQAEDLQQKDKMIGGHERGKTSVENTRRIEETQKKVIFKLLNVSSHLSFSWEWGFY